MTLLVLGLGNPGTRFQGTRHNTGFDVVDKIASKFSVKFKKKLFKPYHYAICSDSNNKYILVKPTTYMNNSGAVLPGLLSKYKLTNKSVLVVVDNLDISKGLIKFKLKGSDGGHNGLKSINDYLGTQEYMRVFIGISRPEKGKSIVDYVLGKIEDDSVFRAEERAVEGILKIDNEPLNQVMNYMNRRVSE